MTNIRKIIRRAGIRCAGLTAAGLAMPSAAWAHSGGGPHLHFVDGFLHPLSGLDHLLAMIAVGCFAAFLGGSALWALPVCFLTLMTAGAALGLGGGTLPFVEPMIALSVAAFGVALIGYRRWAIPAALALVGFFALFHGYAHGAEIPLRDMAVPYGFGFLTATALLHGAGIAVVQAGERFRMPGGNHAATLSGLAFVCAGLGMTFAAW